MSPRRSRRRRNFAVPFVFTVALAPACVPKDSAPTTQRPVANDPAPARGETDGEPDHPPVIIRNPPPPIEARTLPEGWSWVRNDDGSCSAYPPPSKCPPKAMCNPPPPTPIECPPGNDQGGVSKD